MKYNYRTGCPKCGKPHLRQIRNPSEFARLAGDKKVQWYKCMNENCKHEWFVGEAKLFI